MRDILPTAATEYAEAYMPENPPPPSAAYIDATYTDAVLRGKGAAVVAEAVRNTLPAGEVAFLGFFRRTTDDRFMQLQRVRLIVGGLREKDYTEAEVGTLLADALDAAVFA